MNADAVVLSDVSTNNESEYRVVLTNPSGSVTSTPALLMIDSDAVADSLESTYFSHLTNSATADFEGDGVSNLQEFLDDTNPTNSASGRYRLLVLRDGGSAIKTLDQISYTNGEAVTLTAISNITYRVEFNPGLENPTNWNPLPGDITASKLDPLTSTNRFYRVRLLP